MSAAKTWAPSACRPDDNLGAMPGLAILRATNECRNATASVRELHSQFDLAGCRSEQAWCVEKRPPGDAGVQVGVALIQRIRVRTDHAQIAEGEIRMVEHVEGFQAKLQAEALGEFMIVYYGHVPDVEVGRIERVAAHVGGGACTSLNVLGIRIGGNIANNIGICVLDPDKRQPSRRFLGIRRKLEALGGPVLILDHVVFPRFE